MVKPGPLSPNDAAYLNDQLRELEVLKRRVEGLLGQAPELIPAAVTSQTTVSWTTVVTGTTTTTYSVVQGGWYEEGHNVQGTRVTLIGGRTGTNLVDPARTPDGSAISPTPTPTSPVHVWLRKTGLAATHGMIHEVVGLATIATSGTATVFSGARVYRTTNTTMGATSNYAVSFTNEEYDTDSYHDNSVSNNVFTIPTDGYYHVGACVAIEEHAAASLPFEFQGFITKNSTPFVSVLNIVFLDWNAVVRGGIVHLSSDHFFTAGDVIEMYVHNGSDQVASVLGSPSSGFPFFWIHKIT